MTDWTEVTTTARAYTWADDTAWDDRRVWVDAGWDPGIDEGTTWTPVAADDTTWIEV